MGINWLSKDKYKSILLSTSGNVTIKMLTIKELLETYQIKNWSKNRKPDQVRIEQIRESFTDSEVVDGIIAGWKKIGENTLFIYDGIHRFSAAKDLKNMKIIIKITETNDETLIISDFRKINLSVSIPFLFLEDNNNLKIKVCE